MLFNRMHVHAVPGAGCGTLVQHTVTTAGRFSAADGCDERFSIRNCIAPFHRTQRPGSGRTESGSSIVSNGIAFE